MSDYLSPIQQIAGFHFNHAPLLIFSLYWYDSGTSHPLLVYDADGTLVQSLPTNVDYNGWEVDAAAKASGAEYYFIALGADFYPHLYTNNGALLKDHIYGPGDILSQDFSSYGGYLFMAVTYSSAHRLLKLDPTAGTVAAYFDMSWSALSIRAFATGIVATISDPTSGSLEAWRAWFWNNLDFTGGPLVLTTTSTVSNIVIFDMDLNSDRVAVLKIDRTYGGAGTYIEFYDFAGTLRETLTTALPKGVYLGEEGAGPLMMTDSRIYMPTRVGNVPTGRVYMWNITQDGSGNKVFTPPAGIGTSDSVGTYFNIPAPGPDKGSLVFP